MERTARSTAAHEADGVAGLFNRYDAELRKFLARMLGGNAADAADVAQEAYLKLHRLRGAREVRYPRALLFRVATNCALDHIVRCKRRQDVNVRMEDAEKEAVPDDASLPERYLLAHDTVQLLQKIVGELTPQRQRVMVMHKFREMTCPQVAAALGLTLSTVEQHLKQAMDYCRQRLRELYEHPKS